MKVLFVAHICPWPLTNGTRQRTYYLLRGLAQQHDVTAVFPLETADEDSGAADELVSFCTRVIPVHHGDDYYLNKRRFNQWVASGLRTWNAVSHPLPSFVRGAMSSTVIDALRRLRAQSGFDAVWSECSTMTEMLRRAGFRRCVTDFHSIEASNLLRTLELSGFYWSKPVHRLDAAKAARYERRLPVRSGPVVVCKEADRERFRPHVDRVFVAPNGIPVLPAADVARAIAGRMLFVGDMSYAPNVDAVSCFCRQVLPLIRASAPAAHLVVVGPGRSQELDALAERGSLTHVGAVDDLAPCFDSAEIAVVPMRLGGGTRLKLLEALARRMAVVSTPVGAEGLGVEDGIHLELAELAAGFAARCISLLGDPARRARLGAAGCDLVRRSYSWDTAVTVAEQALMRVCSTQPERSANQQRHVVTDA